MYPTGLVHSPHSENLNAQNQKTEDRSQQNPPNNNELHTFTSRPLPSPKVDTPIVPTTANRPLPIPNIVSNGSKPLVLPSSNGANQINQANPSILSTSNTGNTPPQRSGNRPYERIPVVSSIPEAGVTISLSQFISLSSEPARQVSTTSNVVEKRTPPPRPINTNYEQFPQVPSQRSLPPRASTGSDDSGSVTSDDRSSRSGSLGSSVKSLVPSKISKLRKSRSDISNSSDSISEKGSQSQIIPMQPPEFKKVYPCLAQCKDLENFKSVEEVANYLKTLSELPVTSFANCDISLLKTEEKTFLCQVWSVFNHIQSIQNLYTLMKIDPQGWVEIDVSLDEGISSLLPCFETLNKLDPKSEKGKQLLGCLSRELARQFKLLDNKKISIEQVRNTDPFSAKRVAHMNYIWALVIEELFNDAQNDCLKVKKEKHERSSIKNAQKNSSGELVSYSDVKQFDSSRLESLFEPHRAMITSFQEKKQKELKEAKLETRVTIPTAITIDKHPVEKGKEEALQFLYNRLRAIGFQDFEAEKFTEGKLVQEAVRRVLNNQKFLSDKPDTQRIVASLNGVTGCYEMETIYVEEWISSADTRAEGIPRNFKIHRLYKIEDDDNKVLMRNIIGHGVLDGWTEKDTQKRADSNAAAAFKVVHKAAQSDPRVSEICKAGHNPKITHVSLLLVTPTTLTQVPLEKMKNHREKDYTKGQFAAFDKVNEQGYIKLEGSQPEVKVITFGFGINKLSTGENNSKVTGGWRNVKKRNQEAMQNLFGDCVQGKRPGGLIGEVMDEIERSMRLDPEQKKLYFDKLLRQMDTVLEIYLTEAYKYSNGDPAKINREIEALLNIANNALAAIDSKRVITISKGCKSDKDRGGVVITEIFHNAIIEDLGGNLTHNQKLSDEEKAIYLNIATSQFHIHTANTGLPGNKAIGRALNDDEMVFLKGLSIFARE